MCRDRAATKSGRRTAAATQPCGVPSHGTQRPHNCEAVRLYGATWCLATAGVMTTNMYVCGLCSLGATTRVDGLAVLTQAVAALNPIPLRLETVNSALWTRLFVERSTPDPWALSTPHAGANASHHPLRDGLTPRLHRRGHGALLSNASASQPAPRPAAAVTAAVYVYRVLSLHFAGTPPTTALPSAHAQSTMAALTADIRTPHSTTEKCENRTWARATALCLRIARLQRPPVPVRGLTM